MCIRDSLTGAAYGALNKCQVIREGGLLLRSTSATPLQQLEGFKREATIVSAELDDEAAVIISFLPSEGCGGGESRRRAPDDKYSPHSPTRLLTRPAVLWCVAIFGRTDHTTPRKKLEPSAPWLLGHL